MVRCPNCGQKTSGGNCQWCKYPILKGRQREAEVAAREKVKREAEEARKAKEAEKRAKKEAVIAAREKVKRAAEEAREAKEAEEQASKEAVRVLLSKIDFDQAKHLEECLKEIESTREELRVGKIGTEEAIQRLRDISERMSK